MQLNNLFIRKGNQFQFDFWRYKTMTPEDLYVDIGINIHIRLWNPVTNPAGSQRSYLLVHGLSSNARTWDQVAARLAVAGHQAIAVDQRGHGLSDKPEDGYDFATITEDLGAVLDNLDWENPILVGQSWGGNVLLEYAAQNPGAALGYVFVDGGYISLRGRGSWEQIASELRPPNLEGLPLPVITEKIHQAHPDWSDEGIEATLGNFEIQIDQTIRPWLTMKRHMRILKAMYDQDPPSLYPRVEEPVLICAADDGSDRMSFKKKMVQEATSVLKQAEVIWFENSAHDIHVDQPDRLADTLLAFQP
jgi:pimeloyl-ACP methyl ester carboxylesterase